MTARHAPRSLTPAPMAARRRPWLTLADAAQTLAARLEAMADPAERLHPGHPIADFRHLLRAVRPSHFPVQAASAVLLAEAFVKAGEAFCVATSPDWRRDFAGVLEAAGRAVAALLHEQRAQEAERSWKRHTGDA